MPSMRGKPKGLPDAAYALFTGRSERSEPKTTQGRTNEILERAQAEGLSRGEAKSRLAAFIGVSVRTIERYASGRQEAKDTRSRQSATGLHQALRDSRMGPSRRQQVRAAATGEPQDPVSPVSDLGISQSADGHGDFSQEARNTAGAARADLDNGLTITGKVTVSSDTKERTLTLGKWVPDGELDHLADVFVQHGPGAVAAEINRLISTYYVQGMTIDNITSIYFNTINEEG
ncbi:hypothetical protein GCM10010156_76980 [Planobispora rosea]|uniref:Uncharacterized protein n=1 Tax=Planobispora rosea TaxID=35762 RepID=A0A8J3SC84_PLARO|nr:hypothetical protein [Planobispora rosea]GGT08629.1 hypothetical protein GCM10010156_76980 [Planobispora rosea]GIH89139.1 hypothetical protein Pro02_75470 [Planobispora rosea]